MILNTDTPKSRKSAIPFALFASSVNVRIAAILLGVTLSSPSSTTLADAISWVGYQFGPPGGLTNLSNDASFFHGDQWLNYLVPDLFPEPGDVAIFDERFDLQGNGMPHSVYFGDFTVPAVPLYIPQKFTVAGGNAQIHQLVIRDGEFNFRFIDEFGAPQGSLSTTAQMAIADQNNTDATLRIHGGRLTTGFVTHIAPVVGSRGVVEVDGVGAEWIQQSYLDLGWVADGRVTLKNGGRMESSGNIYAGIRNGSKGTLEVLSGGELVANASVLIGNGHEATGLARGVFTVSGNGSRMLAPYLQVGGPGGTGKAVISQQGTVKLSQGLAVFADSTVDVSDMGIVNIGAGDLPDAGTLRVGPGGFLAGSGTIIGNVLVDGGSVAPGFSPGTLHINGNFHQLPTGLLTMEIGGATPGTQYDQLLISGDLLLEGTVQIAFINGFVPQVGDRFDLFGGATFNLTGPLNFINAPPNFQYSSSLSNGVFTVNVVPEPSTLLLLTLGAMAVAVHPSTRRHLWGRCSACTRRYQIAHHDAVSLHFWVKQFIIIVVASPLLCLEAAGQQESTWNGSQPSSVGDWNDPSNWTPFGGPGPFETAVFIGPGNATSLNLGGVDRNVSILSYRGTFSPIVQNGTLRVGNRIEIRNGASIGGPGGVIGQNIIAPATVISEAAELLTGEGLPLTHLGPLVLNNGRIRQGNSSVVKDNAIIIHSGGGTISGEFLNVSSKISGLGALSIEGPKVILSSVAPFNNTYEGGTTVTPGSQVEVTSDSNFGKAGTPLTLFDGSRLSISNDLTLSRQVQLAAVPGASKEIDTKQFTLTHTGNIDRLGAIVGGNLIKRGTGTLILKGDPNDDFDLNVLEGLVVLDKSVGAAINTFGAAVGSLAVAGPSTTVRLNQSSQSNDQKSHVSVQQGTLDLQSYYEGVPGIDLQSGHVVGIVGSTLSIRNSAGLPVQSTGFSYIQSQQLELIGQTIIQVNDVSLSISANVTNDYNGQAAGLVKTGLGTLILTGANTYSGGTTIVDGVLQCNASSLPGNVTNNGAVVFDQTTNATFSGNMSGAGGITLIHAGTLNFSGVNSYSGGTTVSGGTGIFTPSALPSTGSIVVSPGSKIAFGTTGSYGAPGQLLTLNGGSLEMLDAGVGFQTVWQGNISLAANSTITRFGVPPVVGFINGSVSGPGGLTTNGVLQLSGINTYGGGTTVNSGVATFTPAALPSIGNVVVSPGSKIAFGTTGSYGAPGQLLTLNGGSLDMLDAGVGFQTAWQGNISLAANSTITRFGVSPVVGFINGSVSGPGGLTTNGVLQLSGINTYGGGTTVNSGVATFTPAALPSIGNVVVSPGSKIAFGTTGSYGAPGQLLTLNGGSLEMLDAGVGFQTVWQGNISLAANSTITRFGVPPVVGFINGSVSGPGALTTNGVIQLTGTNTYSGGTTVNSGSLRIDGSVIGPVTVNAGATLNGSGTIGGNVTVLNGGTLRGTPRVQGSITNDGSVAPGLSPGILSLSGTFSQASAGTLAIDVGGPVIGVDTDRLAVAGAASLGGKLEVTLPNLFATTLGTTYDILTASSVTGSFSSSTGRLVNPQIFLGIVYLPDRVRLRAANAGDVNLDGIVNIFDINSVSSAWNTGSPSGDANTDGIVNIFDINLISSNWGATAGNAMPVPEPSTLVLLLLGAMAVAVRRGLGRPGFSPGTLHINGNVHQLPAGR